MTKYTKLSANYIKRTQGQRPCAFCRYYNKRKKSCSEVSGYISPNATCNYWKAR